jgi:hypothetical protein
MQGRKPVSFPATHGDVGPIRELSPGVLSCASTSATSQDAVQSFTQHKKPKVEDVEPHDGEWLHVERRKSEKARRRGKTRRASAAWPSRDGVLQPSMPRFMYVNGEIVKRKNAIHIDASLPASSDIHGIIVPTPRMYVISSSTTSQTRHFPTGSRSRYIYPILRAHRRSIVVQPLLDGLVT